MKNKKTITIILAAVLILAVLAAVILIVKGGGEHTVVFQYSDGTVIATVKVKHGEAAQSPAVANKNGYIFSHWDKDISYVTSDMVVTAVMVQVSDLEWKFTRVTGDLLYSDINGKSVVYNGDLLEDVTEVVFPSKDEDGNSVLEIGMNALGKLRDKVERVVIPEGVLSIAENAFAGCTALKEVVIADSVKVIGENAFYNTSLTELEFGSKLAEIEGPLFGERSEPVTIKVAAGNTNIAVKERNIVSKDGKTFILYTDFGNREVTISSPVNTIGEKAFYMSGVESVKLPETLRTIQAEAFKNCMSLTDVEISSNTLDSIGDGAFSNTGIKEILLPESLRQIGNNAFSDTKLVRVIIPDATRTLGEDVFSGTGEISIYCRAQRSNMPANESWASGNPVKYGYSGGNDGLALQISYVYVRDDGSERVLLTETTEFAKSIARSGYIPSSSETEGKEFSGWSTTNDKSGMGFVEEALTRPVSDVKIYAVCIGNSIFTYVSYEDGYLVSQGPDAKNYEVLDLPEQYNGKPVLGIMDAPSSAENYDELGFRGLTMLKRVLIPSGYIYIGSCAFSGCVSLEYVNLPEGLKEIKDETFLGCSSLISVDIPLNCTTVGNKAFYQCRSLASVNLGNVVEIGNSAFEETALTVLDLPMTLSIIGARAFYGAGTFSKVVIPPSVTMIKGYAFNGSGLFIDCTAFKKSETEKMKWISTWHGSAQVEYAPEGEIM